jgi:RNA-directed DNA polymerase
MAAINSRRVVRSPWVRQWRGRRARGEMIVVRFADDAVVGFEHHDDAQRFLADLRERFAEFNLECRRMPWQG